MPRYKVEFLDDVETELSSVSEQRAVEFSEQPQTQYEVEFTPSSTSMLTSVEQAYGVEFVDRIAILL